MSLLGGSSRPVVVRMVRAPLSVMHHVRDGCIPTWLRWLGVELGDHCRFAGLPQVRMEQGARISIGDGVHILSVASSNPAGIGFPCALAALSGATIVIGDGCGLSGASLVARQRIELGRRVLVGAGACIWDNDFHPIDAAARRTNQADTVRRAAIHIEDDVFIGARAMILKGVHIGARAVVGAGAVVTADVPPDTLVAGNPARPRGSGAPLKRLL